MHESKDKFCNLSIKELLRGNCLLYQQDLQKGQIVPKIARHLHNCWPMQKSLNLLKVSEGKKARNKSSFQPNKSSVLTQIVLEDEDYGRWQLDEFK